jgi:tRNA nucleotidyltransferase (CCA-adding enzyme)
MTVTVYEVGGAVRDSLRGVESKDRDFVVEAPSWEAMRAYIRERGTIYLETPKYLTIRAKLDGVNADYVLARKESEYTDGRHPDRVEPGTIDDDLGRRDFTMNAIARRADGTLYDPHGGAEDIRRRLIRCVGDPDQRFYEDALRLLRALRFAVTTGFDLCPAVVSCLNSPAHLDRLGGVSVERTREELNKAFRHDTLATLTRLNQHPSLTRRLFSDNRLWLEATLKAR